MKKLYKALIQVQRWARPHGLLIAPRFLELGHTAAIAHAWTLLDITNGGYNDVSRVRKCVPASLLLDSPTIVGN